MDVAFSRASKLTLPKTKKPSHVRMREREMAKLKSIQEVLTSRLEEVVKRFPNFDDIHPFYRTLADTIVPIDELRQALASVTSSARVIERIIQKSRQQLKKAETPSEARRQRVAAYGRISSVIKRLEPRLEVIQFAAREYRRFPSVNLTLPVLAVAGFPNVGKSSLVRLVSSAQPEVAEYPFTTKKISLGHLPLEPSGGQILDLPGLLDRPMTERNPIERRAIAAIQYLADCILFLIDPTLTCGYELPSQISLFQEIVGAFPSVEMFPALNKCDIATNNEKAQATERLGVSSIPCISTLTGESVEDFVQVILKQSVSVQEKLKVLRAQGL